MADVRIVNGYPVLVTPEGKLMVDAQVSAQVADSKIKGSTDAGTTWVPVKVDSEGNVGVLLNGRKASRVQTVLTTTPLAASAEYTQPGIDAEAWSGAGGTGAVVVSGMAKADKPGTLFLQVSHDNATWTTWDAALVNSTGVARLRPTTIPLRYFRFHYVNGGQAQTSFVLVQNIMQEGDGRGGEYGTGMDLFRRYGTIAAGTTETVVDLRSPVEMVFAELSSDYSDIYLGFQSYKDDGTAFQVPWDHTGNGTGSTYAHKISEMNSVPHPYFDVVLYNTTDNKYKIKKRDGVPPTFARGLKITVTNSDTVVHNVSMHCFVRIL